LFGLFILPKAETYISKGNLPQDVIQLLNVVILLLDELNNIDEPLIIKLSLKYLRTPPLLLSSC